MALGDLDDKNKYIDKLKQQNAALVEAMEGILNINNPPWGEPGHVDFTTAIKMGRKALAQAEDN